MSQIQTAQPAPTLNLGRCTCITCEVLPGIFSRLCQDPECPVHGIWPAEHAARSAIAHLAPDMLILLRAIAASTTCTGCVFGKPIYEPLLPEKMLATANRLIRQADDALASGAPAEERAS